MEHRIYFIIGDILSVTTTGVAVSLTCLALTPSDWNMFIAMLAGMAIGMITALVISGALFVRYFGAMEVMVPSMLTGILTGMVVSMAATMTSPGYSTVAYFGIAIGLLTLLATYFLNKNFTKTTLETQ